MQIRKTLELDHIKFRTFDPGLGLIAKGNKAEARSEFEKLPRWMTCHGMSARWLRLRRLG